MLADLAKEALTRASQLKARRSNSSVSNGRVNGHSNGAAAAATPLHNNKGEGKPRRVLIPALLNPVVTVWLLSAATVVVLLLYYFTPLGWMWKNQYLYLNCPERSFWQRRPERRFLNLKLAGGYPYPVRLHYISAKFNGKPGEDVEAIMKQHARKVRRSGVFPEAKNLHFYSKFPDWVTKESRWARHLEHRNQTKHPSREGSGFWFWKPFIIDHHLHSKEIRDGDFVVFSDPDRVDFLSWIGLLIETMIIQKADLALEQTTLLERQWSKGDAYKFFCQISGPPSDDREDGMTAPETKYLYPNDDKSCQYHSSFMVVRRNPKTMNFIGGWVWASRNYDMLSDLPSKTNNAFDFKKHRHAQSFLSLLLKCRLREPAKTLFPQTCLTQRKLFTFQIER